MVSWLADHPDRWSTVHAVSRRPPKSTVAPHVQHHSLDLLTSTPEDLAQILKERDVEIE
jgi:hypothetical protein